MKRISKNKKVLIPILLLLAVVIAGVALYIKTSHKQEAQKTDQQQLQDEQKQAAPADTKTSTEASQRQQAAAQGSTAATASSKAAINPVITTLEQSGDMIILDATVGEATTGTCSASFDKSGSASVKRSTPVTRVTSYYACTEMQIPRSEFSKAGEWNVTLSFSSDKYAGSTTKKVTIN